MSGKNLPAFNFTSLLFQHFQHFLAFPSISSGNFFWGTLLHFAAFCGNLYKLCDYSSRIWSVLAAANQNICQQNAVKCGEMLKYLNQFQHFAHYKIKL